MPNPSNFVAGFCPNVQETLVDIAGCAAPQFKRGRHGFVESLKSPLNVTGHKQLNFGSGKNHNVQLFYVPRALTTDVTVGTTMPLCNVGGIRPKPLDQIINVSRSAYYDMSFDQNDMRRICQADTQFIKDNVLGSFEAIIKKINIDLLAIALANIGQYEDGSVTKTFNILTGVPPQMNWDGISDMSYEYQLIQGCGLPILVGGKRSWELYKMGKIGCCNNQGIDVSKSLDDFFFFNDQEIETSLGANNNILYEPGAYQFMEWFENVGDYEMLNSEIHQATTIVDPSTNMTFDMLVDYKHECREYHVRIYKWYDLFTIPTDAFAVGDPLAGVRGTLRAVLT